MKIDKMLELLEPAIESINHVDQEYLASVLDTYTEVISQYHLDSENLEYPNGYSLSIEVGTDGKIYLWKRDSKGSGSGCDIFKVLDYVRRSREMLLKNEIKSLKAEIECYKRESEEIKKRQGTEG